MVKHSSDRDKDKSFSRVLSGEHQAVCLLTHERGKAKLSGFRAFPETQDFFPGSLLDC